MLKKIPFIEIHVTRDALFFLSPAPTYQSFTFNLKFLCTRFISISSQNKTRPGMKSSLSIVKCLVLFTRFRQDEISVPPEGVYMEITFRDKFRPRMKSSLSTVKCLLLFIRFLPKWNLILGSTHPCQKDRDEISSQDEKKKKNV